MTTATAATTAIAHGPDTTPDTDMPTHGRDAMLRGPLFTADARAAPYWLDEAPVASDAPDATDTATALPDTIDCLIVGAGYTGLSAAIETARAGRSTLVLDAGPPGAGCSTRNGGQVSTGIKPALDRLAQRFGMSRARAMRGEGEAALDWLADFIAREEIPCDFRRVGRFHAAHTPQHYERLARDADNLSRRENIPAHMVPRAEQRREIGTDVYFGGCVFPRHGALHPAKLHHGLMSRARAAGADLRGHCAVTGIMRDGNGFQITTARGQQVRARKVLVATNGYTGGLVPWLQRRVMPIGSYMIASEPLPRALMDELFPTDRIVSDSCKVIYYFRAAPDRSRILFGGRVSAGETDPALSGPKLHADMCRIFPQLRSTRIARSWMGTVAYTFDELPHIGVHDGVHYAMGYCGVGIALSGYLGMRAGRQMLGQANGRTAFDDLPFPSPPLYRGAPWFLPAVIAWYRWQDRREYRSASAAAA